MNNEDINICFKVMEFVIMCFVILIIENGGLLFIDLEGYIFYFWECFGCGDLEF